MVDPLACCMLGSVVPEKCPTRVLALLSGPSYTDTQSKLLSVLNVLNLSFGEPDEHCKVQVQSWLLS